MCFQDFILFDSIIVALNATTKDAAISEMVQALVAAGGIPEADQEDVVRALLKREQLGSTAIGRGIAVPHTKIACVERLVGLVAISPEGVDFDALDGEKVNLFFPLVSPPDRAGEHLRALEHITKQLKDDGFVRYLKQAPTREAVRKLLEEADNADFQTPNA